VAALALVVFGVGLAAGILAGEARLLLTVLPAAVAPCGIAAALLIAPRASTYAALLQAKHVKIERAITTPADAVNDTNECCFSAADW
jgi:hypothetical protein